MAIIGLHKVLELERKGWEISEECDTLTKDGETLKIDGRTVPAVFRLDCQREWEGLAAWSQNWDDPWYEICRQAAKD